MAARRGGVADVEESWIGAVDRGAGGQTGGRRGRVGRTVAMVCTVVSCANCAALVLDFELV